MCFCSVSLVHSFVLPTSLRRSNSMQKLGHTSIMWPMNQIEPNKPECIVLKVPSRRGKLTIYSLKKISYQNLLLLITYLLSMLSNLEFQHMSITRHRQREHLNGSGRVGRLLVGCSWRPKDHGYRTACRLASRGTNHRSGDD